MNKFIKQNVLVCMQHALTPEQSKDFSLAKSVSYLREVNPELFGKLSNISPSISMGELRLLANELAQLLRSYDAAILPIGSPEFGMVLASVMGYIAYSGEIIATCVFARSERVSVDERQADGSVLKKSVFAHAGWGEVVL
jgi:hypothetical protein